MWECVCRSTPLTHWNGIPPGDVKALTFGPCPGILSLARVCPASNHTTHLKHMEGNGRYLIQENLIIRVIMVT